MAVIKHDEEIPEAENSIEDACGRRRGKLCGNLLQALHALGEVAHLKAAEKGGGKRQELEPQRRFRRYTHMVLEPHDRETAHKLQECARHARDEHDLHDDEMRLLVETRYDVAENRLRDKRRDDRDEARKEAAEQDRPKIFAPAKTHRPPQPCARRIASFRNHRIEAIRLALQPVRHLGRDFHALAVLYVNVFIAFRIYGERRERLAPATNKQGSEIFFVPIPGKLHPPPMKPAAQGNQVQDFAHIRKVWRFNGKAHTVSFHAVEGRDFAHRMNDSRLLPHFRAVNERNLGQKPGQELAARVVQDPLPLRRALLQLLLLRAFLRRKKGFVSLRKAAIFQAIGGVQQKGSRLLQHIGRALQHNLGICAKAYGSLRMKQYDAVPLDQTPLLLCSKSLHRHRKPGNRIVLRRHDPCALLKHFRLAVGRHMKKARQKGALRTAKSYGEK